MAPTAPSILAAMLCIATAWSGATARATTLPTPPTGALAGEKPAELRRARIPAMLLTPLPATGAVPRMVPRHVRPGTPQSWELARAQIRAIRMKHFGASGPAVRAAGLEAMRQMTDPAAFEEIYGELKGEKQDVKLAMLSHFAAQGQEGQFTLACIAIQDPDKAMRAEATRRIQRPPSDAVLAALDEGLRAESHEIVNNAGLLAGSVHAIEALPALIFAQFAQSATAPRGDLAWIAVGKTTSYVANVIPVVGDNSGAYQPVIGQVIEGVVMEVQDCVVTTYRGDVHDALVAMSSFDSGTETAQLGWNMHAWWRWFNEQYVPLKQREDQELAKAAATPR